MKFLTLLLGSALVFTSDLHAQQTPWAKLPATKKIATIEGREKTLWLKLDTLTIQEAVHPAIPFYSEITHWYSQPTKKVGYGYVTEEGKPFGVWRYFVLSGNQYELFCEGYFAFLTAANLVVDADNAKRFAGVNFDDVKHAFVSGVKEHAFFTGEWRFYKAGKLDKIVTLDNKVALPLEEVMVEEDTEGSSSTKLALALPEKIHPAGTVLSTVYFAPDGRIIEIAASGLSLKFAKDGRPVIAPLQEPAYLD